MIKSRYCEKNITYAQYVAELVCENSARKHNYELCSNFWQEEGWKEYYARQVIKANKLIKEFGHEKLVGFVNEKKIYSLFAKWLPEALSKYIVPEQKAESLQRAGQSSGVKNNKKTIIDGL